MKFVYFGYDFMLDSVRRLREDGHELMGIMSFACDNVFNFNRKTCALAEECGVPLSLAKVEERHIRNFLDQGVNLFVSAGYIHKIPAIPEGEAYGINVHPSYLPLGRGLMPTPYILLQQPEAAGLTIHRLEKEIDRGRILYQEKINITQEDDVETYSARIALRAPDILSMVAGDLPRYWEKAELQDENRASHFPPPPDAMRTLDWHDTVDGIERTHRAFGRYGCLAEIGGRLYAVYNLKGWVEAHRFHPGDIACLLSREVVVAVRDGFICLKEVQELER